MARAAGQDVPADGDVVPSPEPPALDQSVAAIARSALGTAVMVVRGRLTQPRDQVGTEIAFADGASAVVFRETVTSAPGGADPVALVVCFRPRYIGHSRLAHWVCRRTCVVDLPLFAGFPRFRTTPGGGAATDWWRAVAVGSPR